MPVLLSWRWGLRLGIQMIRWRWSGGAKRLVCLWIVQTYLPWTNTTSAAISTLWYRLRPILTPSWNIWNWREKKRPSRHFLSQLYMNVNKQYVFMHARRNTYTLIILRSHHLICLQSHPCSCIYTHLLMTSGKMTVTELQRVSQCLIL